MEHRTQGWRRGARQDLLTRLTIQKVRAELKAVDPRSGATASMDSVDRMVRRLRKARSPLAG